MLSSCMLFGSDAVVPSSDHYCSDIVASSGDHCITAET